MCNCRKDYVKGSHEDEVYLKIPEIGHTMSQYIKNRQKVGLSIDSIIRVDSCLKEEILYLWSIKIKTHGCCCGHNISDGMINVDDSDIEKMKKIGYEVQYNPNFPDSEWTFYPKSIKRIEG